MCKEFPQKLTRKERVAWDSFVVVVLLFLRNHKAGNYVELVDNLQRNTKEYKGRPNSSRPFGLFKAAGKIGKIAVEVLE